jgi:genome maintenance exonuclease 1
MYNHLTTVAPLDMRTTEGDQGRFYLAPSGNQYPSVTTVLGHGEKAWLAEWRESLGAEKADQEMHRAATRGSAVHLIIERHLQNHPSPTEGFIQDHIREYNSTKFALKHVNNIVLQESALFSDTLKLAGRVDCIAEYDGVLSIIDFKTSTTSKTHFMITDYYLQTTAYALMFEEMYGITINDIVIIMSVEKGLPLVFKQKIEDYIAPLCQRINTYYKAQGVYNDGK